MVSALSMFGMECHLSSQVFMMKYWMTIVTKLRSRIDGIRTTTVMDRISMARTSTIAKVGLKTSPSYWKLS